MILLVTYQTQKRHQNSQRFCPNLSTVAIGSWKCLGFITGKWVRVGQVRVRVTPKAPAENPHPQGGFGGFLYLNKSNTKHTNYNKLYKIK